MKKIRTNIVRDKQEPWLVNVELGTKKASIWKLVELSAKILARAEEYNAKYIQLESPKLKNGERKALQFQLKFTNLLNLEMFLQQCENIYMDNCILIS